MLATTTEGEHVAKKQGGTKEPKRYGTLIRVSDAFADALRNASSFEKMSMAEFSDSVLLPIVQKRYRDAVIREAKRMEGGAK
jgi:hypothetical protein